MSDLISRADAIEAVRKELVCDGRHETHDKTCRFIADVLLSALPSADTEESYLNAFYDGFNTATLALSAEAEPTVIRSKTLLPTKDFKEWAKRIREVNPNAVVIPCDAEVASAEAVHGWIPCSKRLPENTAEWKAYLTCNEAGIISTTYWADGWNCWRNPDGEIDREYEIKNIVAWMPLPKPYKGGDE